MTALITQATIRVVLVSEGAMFEGGEMVFADSSADDFGHMKLGGIGDLISARLRR